VKLIQAFTVVEGPGLEVEQLWYDRTRWASWMDGFRNLARLDDHWPLEGSRRVYDAAHGRVSEVVKRYVAGDCLVSTREDERSSGLARVVFETDGVRTRITWSLDIEPKDKLAPGPRWWLRRGYRKSLERSLVRFGYELAAELDR
jgi:hypothetical protein